MSDNRTPGEAPNVRLGVSPLSWVNEVLEDLGAGTSAEQCLSEAKAAGFEGVETSRIFPAEPAALGAALSRHGLDLVSGWHSGLLATGSVENEIESVRDHARLLAGCGAKVMVYGECAHMAENALDIPMGGRLELGRDAFASYGERLTRFAEAVRAEYGLGLAYHHHLMMVAERLDEVRAVMDASGEAVGLLLDTGHARAGGFDYSALIEAYAPRINHIHLKDVRGEVLARIRETGGSFNEGVRAGMFTVPGDGEVDFGPLARFIGSGRYSGWLVVEAEQDPRKAPPAETVTRARRFVSETILETARV